MTRRLLLTLLMGCTALPLAGQMIESINECKILVTGIKDAKVEDRELLIRQSLTVNTATGCYARLFAAPTLSEFAKLVEAARSDKQTGGTASAATTQLVSRGLAAKVLSVAAEHGALTEAVDKQVVTVQGSLQGIPAALIKSGLISFCPSGSTDACASQRTLDFLRRITYSVSFDNNSNQAGAATASTATTAAGAPAGQITPITFTAKAQQISAVSGSYVILNRRDSSQQYVKAWRSLDPAVLAGAQAVMKAGGAFLDALKDTDDEAPEHAALIARSVPIIAAAAATGNEASLMRTWEAFALEYAAMVQRYHRVDPDLPAAYLRVKSAYLSELYDFAAGLSQKPVLTFQFSHNRPEAQDPTSNARLIFEKGLAKNWSLVFNAGATIYTFGDTTHRITKLRDAQAGGQLERTLPKLPVGNTSAAVDAGYYFQYQNSPAVLNVTPAEPLPGITFIGLPDAATKVFADKGNLHVGQLRLLLSPGSASMRVPLSFSYSNRTELITKPTWKAQIGIAYDFDSLFAK